MKAKMQTSTSHSSASDEEDDLKNLMQDNRRLRDRRCWLRGRVRDLERANCDLVRTNEQLARDYQRQEASASAMRASAVRRQGVIDGMRKTNVLLEERAEFHDIWNIWIDERVDALQDLVSEMQPADAAKLTDWLDAVYKTCNVCLSSSCVGTHEFLCKEQGCRNTICDGCRPKLTRCLLCGGGVELQ
jgi:hypothetical protein